jgi:hypothetical protein
MSQGGSCIVNMDRTETLMVVISKFLADET